MSLDEEQRPKKDYSTMTPLTFETSIGRMAMTFAGFLFIRGTSVRTRGGGAVWSLHMVEPEDGKCVVSYNIV